MKKLNLSEIKIWEPSVRMPVSEEDLATSSWSAHSLVGGRLVMVSVMPSAKHPGFVHYEVMQAVNGEWWASKEPVMPSHVGDFLAHILKPLGIDVTALTWRKSNSASPDAPKGEIPGLTGTCVYFLRAGPFIKIGKATGSPTTRVRELQTGCPYPITIIASVCGGLKEEFELHRRFGSYRAHGEWFRDEGELAEYVASLAEVPA